MTLDPHSNEEDLQAETEAEAKTRYGQNRYEYEEPIDLSSLGGNAPEQLPAALPNGKSPAFYAEGGRMLVEESKASRLIRANKARIDADLPLLDNQ